MLVFLFAALAFIVGCGIGGILGWLDRYAAGLGVADERLPSRDMPKVKAA